MERLAQAPRRQSGRRVDGSRVRALQRRHVASAWVIPLVLVLAGLGNAYPVPGGAGLQIRLADGLRESTDVFTSSKYGGAYTRIEDLPILTGCHVRLAAVATRDLPTEVCFAPAPCETHWNHRVEVRLFLTDEGTRLNRQIREAHDSRNMAIMLDGEVLVVLDVLGPDALTSNRDPDARIDVAGRFAEEEAASIAARINQARCRAE